MEIWPNQIDFIIVLINAHSFDVIILVHNIFLLVCFYTTCVCWWLISFVYTSFTFFFTMFAYAFRSNEILFMCYSIKFCFFKHCKHNSKLNVINYSVSKKKNFKHDRPSLPSFRALAKHFSTVNFCVCVCVCKVQNWI